MTTVAEWVEGARPRTLPAAAAPVIAGTGVAAFVQAADLGRVVLALVVALALQIGVNYANDYSDGVRGTDADRVGPQRLVGSGAAAPKTVRRAAFACFALAGVAGLWLVVLTGAWWLLAVGAACILAAWYYTGGRRPYGYAGWGEVFVFVFFGLVAVGGTTFVQTGDLPAAAVWAGVVMGALSCAILVANNLRDIATDAVAGKRTLAVHLGDEGSRWFYAALVALSVAGLVAIGAATTWWALLGLVALLLLVPALRLVLGGAHGPDLVRALKLTGLAELAASVGLFVGLVIA